MNNCDKYIELISDYIDSAHDLAMDAELKAHLESCPSCCEEYSAMQSLVHELNSLPALPLPEGFHSRAMENIRKETRKRTFTGINFAQYTSVAAAVMLCFVLLGGTLSFITSGIVNRDIGAVNELAYDQAARVPLTAPAAAPAPLADTAAGTMPAPAAPAPAAPPPAAMPAPGIALDTGVPVAGRGDEPATEESREISAWESGTHLRIDTDDETRRTWTARDQQDLTPVQTLPPRAGVHSDHMNIISRNYSINLTVEDMNLAVLTLRTAGHEIERSEISQHGSFIVLNVPAHEYVNAQILARSLGEIRTEWEGQTDLTHATNDLAIRYLTRLEESTRLASLIELAERAEDIILLQNRISQIEHERARLRGSYNQNLTRAGNFTVSISLTPVGTPVYTYPVAFPQRVSRAFTGSVNFTTALFEGVLVVLASTVVPLTLIAGTSAAGYFLYKKFKKPPAESTEQGGHEHEDE